MGNSTAKTKAGDLKWCPGSGDRVCSAHFQSGLASNDPWEADNVPDLATRLQREPISLEQDFAEKVEKASDVSALAAETRACST